MNDIVLKTVEIDNGETLGYRVRRGGDKVLLLIHGNMTSSKHWDLLLESIDEKYTVYAVDMRGFGLSSYHKSINSIKDFSDDIKLFVDRLQLQTFSIIGWSTGGAVGMQFVIDHPDYVEKLILLESASTRGYPFNALDGWKLVRLKSKEEIANDRSKAAPVLNAYKNRDGIFLKMLWNSVIYTHNEPSPERYQEYIEDMLTQRNIVDVYSALNTFNISKHHNGLTEGSNQAENITIPTLVLWGERDRVVSKEMTHEIIEDLGDNAQLVYLKGCGHSPLVDDLDQLLHEIYTFLDR
ncbi:alpha/beta fold hydrolase [Anaerobacillus sp. MEB173]|uniref:intracellular short-chain-length polyhydroxyalkanoate depolymerase n=1 Tax=Anaerobacillus sp. MEB173 TaxID=3383345 RepID=UPI003F8EC081